MHGNHGINKSPMPTVPLSQINTALVPTGLGAFHDPKINAGRDDHHAKIASRTVVSLSPAILICLKALFQLLLYSTP